MPGLPMFTYLVRDNRSFSRTRTKAGYKNLRDL